MSQRNRKPIRIREIGGRFDALPSDLATIIEPMANREYFQLRYVSENIADEIIQDTINSQFINREILVDTIHYILESMIGYTLFEFLDNYTYYYNNPRTSSYTPMHMPGSTLLTKWFVNKGDITYYVAYVNERIIDQILPQHKKSLINFNTYTGLNKPLLDAIGRYIGILFKDEGYLGITVADVIDDYNQYL